jgi:hypothetical protein
MDISIPISETNCKLVVPEQMCNTMCALAITTGEILTKTNVDDTLIIREDCCGRSYNQHELKDLLLVTTPTNLITNIF